LKKDITITTNSGERVTIGPGTELSEERLREIVAAVEGKSAKATSE
jgi:hypothetical protein